MAGQRRLIIGVTIAAGTAMLTYFLPLFHVIPLGGTPQNEAFEPAAFVDRFWTDQLLPASDQAVNASKLVAALRDDPQAAARAFCWYSLGPAKSITTSLPEPGASSPWRRTPSG